MIKNVAKKRLAAFHLVVFFWFAVALFQFFFRLNRFKPGLNFWFAAHILLLWAVASYSCEIFKLPCIFVCYIVCPSNY